jgi:hypothetical protein
MTTRIDSQPQGQGFVIITTGVSMPCFCRHVRHRHWVVSMRTWLCGSSSNPATISQSSGATAQAATAAVTALLELPAPSVAPTLHAEYIATRQRKCSVRPCSRCTGYRLNDFLELIPRQDSRQWCAAVNSRTSRRQRYRQRRRACTEPSADGNSQGQAHSRRSSTTWHLQSRMVPLPK